MAGREKWSRTHAHHHHAALEAGVAVALETTGYVDARAVAAGVLSDPTLVDVRAVRAVRVDGEARVTHAHETAHRVAAKPTIYVLKRSLFS